MKILPAQFQRMLPGFSLMLLVPLVAEVLPGATRLHAMFVFPIEIGVWGVGALFIREAVRKWNLGWRNMLLLAFALAMAEEFLIQQSSLAPLVVQITKGQPYARYCGINWLYLIWALGYESVLVVLVPIALNELIFRERRMQAWMNRSGAIFCSLYFGLSGFLAWFSWTKIARPKVFHVPTYTPPALTLAIGAAITLMLVAAAIGPFRRTVAMASRPLKPPRPWLLFLASLVPAPLWYGLSLLCFGIRLDFPPLAAAASAMVLMASILATVPRWAAAADWSEAHVCAVCSGIVLSAMCVGFVGFGTESFDFYGKILLNVLAALLLVALGRRVAHNR